MEYYLHVDCHGIPDTTEIASAYCGIPSARFKIRFFQKESELEQCKPDNIVIGYIPEIQHHLERFGIVLPDLNYPEELTKYLSRRVWKSTVQNFLQGNDGFPIFVKPIKEKLFTGLVVYSPHDEIPKYTFRSKKLKNEAVYCSEVLDIRSEWRVFVRYGKILDVRPYSNHWKYVYDPSVIESAVNDYKSAPSAYGIDFGVTSNGKTILIEVNDAYAIGSYGLDDFLYVKFLTTRWCELMHLDDPYH